MSILKVLVNRIEKRKNHAILLNPGASKTKLAIVQTMVVPFRHHMAYWSLVDATIFRQKQNIMLPFYDLNVLRICSLLAAISYALLTEFETVFRSCYFGVALNSDYSQIKLFHSREIIVACIEHCIDNFGKTEAAQLSLKLEMVI